ncbi:DUF2795 domain-containing protein [Halochromatium glycolicum]|uniref:DUF2795 domain-containing protein n=1 Tax=Halochromatium glycolicum TaxID=85075 RepID=A0AAJ0X937_9GAMM|nr:DUF2795 domain-containing protein [Halochromatium glycolicum]MBK1703640.1 hypothetical protein [Halochromatium glycolicum]
MAQHPPANEMTKHLSGMHFPAKKSELTEHAKQQGARDEGIQAVRDMPQTRFDTMSPRRAPHCGNALNLSAVHEDAQQLSAIGLIDKTDGGKLQFSYDAIDIHLGWQAAAGSRLQPTCANMA